MTGEQTSGTNLRISHINVFLTSVGQNVPLSQGSPEFGERFFFAKMSVSSERI